MTCAGKRSDLKRRAVERIREDAPLTADLGDEAAKLLLDWSSTHVEATFRETEGRSEAELNASLARLRRLLKRVNREAARATPGRQAQRVRSLLAQIESSDAGEAPSPGVPDPWARSEIGADPSAGWCAMDGSGGGTTGGGGEEAG
jgi:hypothetical protein